MQGQLCEVEGLGILGLGAGAGGAVESVEFLEFRDWGQVLEG